MIKRRLFKFKKTSDKNIEDLMNNRLWISNLYLMNDPMDLAFFVDSKKVKIDFDNNDVIKFQAHITKHIFCASFTTVFSNKRLWNYYSDGFFGFALGYKPTDIRKSINALNLQSIEDKITYANTRFDYTNLFRAFLQRKNMQIPIPQKSLFTKDKSWSEEKEYRFSIQNPIFKVDDKGFKLLNVKPCVIYVGYKIKKDALFSIISYCEKNNIPLNVYMPKFDSKELGFQNIKFFNLLLD
ncbi:MAG: DUF2971 domain-containing protein [Bacteroidales bacterium]|jgi:hypothetical protein